MLFISYELGVSSVRRRVILIGWHAISRIKAHTPTCQPLIMAPMIDILMQIMFWYMRWYKLWHEGLKYVSFKGQVSKVWNSFEIPNLSLSVSINFCSHSKLMVFETVLYVHLVNFSSYKGFVVQMLFRLLGIPGLDITVLKTIGPDIGQQEWINKFKK